MEVYITLALMVLGAAMLLYGLLKNKVWYMILSAIPLVIGFIKYMDMYFRQ